MMTAAALALTLLVAQQPKETEKLAPYYPTPDSVVQKMLEVVGLKKGEKMVDLGSGDGRIVIMAAKKFGADSTGIEFDEALYKQSSAKIKSLGLDKTARIIHGDIMVQDYTQMDVITIYLLPLSNEKVRPMLDKQLKKGTRVIAHDFEVGGWNPEKTITIEDDGEGRSHTLFLYLR
ncbi:MAG: class I SAM-dependent methyltransferase [Acidobacteria bacterium]|nr:class I SAM-dependent methyltransferase [Acidobacteriota bacterium]